MQGKTRLTHEIATVQPVAAASRKHRICNSLLLFCLAVFSCSENADAQRIDALGPQVRKYVSVSTPKVILEHVLVIDGTGAAPIPDQNISIEGGKIAAISPGADQPAKEGTTILNLRGYSVMPGIVGMH